MEFILIIALLLALAFAYALIVASAKPVVGSDYYKVSKDGRVLLAAGSKVSALKPTLYPEGLKVKLRGGTRVGVASMERRPGAEYDFNEPLLETLLDQPEWRSGDIVVARQFLLPGRHAGPGGDIERICLEAERRNPGLRLHLTAPLAGHPLLESILAERCLAYRPRS